MDEEAESIAVFRRAGTCPDNAEKLVIDQLNAQANIYEALSGGFEMFDNCLFGTALVDTEKHEIKVIEHG